MSNKLVLFGEASKIKRLGDGEYGFDIPADWSFAVAHGGYLIAMLLTAALLYLGEKQPHPVSLHVEFLRPAKVGRASIKVGSMREGKASSVLSVSVVQNGKERVAGFAV
jgi:acyl-CoA thioesterase